MTLRKQPRVRDLLLARNILERFVDEVNEAFEIPRRPAQVQAEDFAALQMLQLAQLRLLICRLFFMADEALFWLHEDKQHLQT